MWKDQIMIKRRLKIIADDVDDDDDDDDVEIEMWGVGRGGGREKRWRQIKGDRICLPQPAATAIENAILLLIVTAAASKSGSLSALGYPHYQGPCPSDTQTNQPTDRPNLQASQPTNQPTSRPDGRAFIDMNCFLLLAIGRFLALMPVTLIYIFSNRFFFFLNSLSLSLSLS